MVVPAASSAVRKRTGTPTIQTLFIVIHRNLVHLGDAFAVAGPLDCFCDVARRRLIRPDARGVVVGPDPASGPTRASRFSSEIVIWDAPDGGHL